MGKIKFLLAAVITFGMSGTGKSQTYNIPAASGTSTSYLGTLTGDLNLKSTAGSLFLNTAGTTTVPDLGINTQQNVGVGLLPPLDPSSGFFWYQPKLTIKGTDGNNAVPAWSPRATFRINTGTATNLDFGIYGGRPFIGSSTLDLFAGNILMSSTGAGGGVVTLTLGSYGDKITSTGYNGLSVLKGSLVIGNHLGSSPTTPGAGLDYSLFVARGILTEKVKVAVYSTANWADYVFNKEYKLLSLGEVEAYIQKNKHLPGVPSAEDVVKEGIDMATMDAKLLEKIEELTLYLIEMKKENESLKKRVELLEIK